MDGHRTGLFRLAGNQLQSFAPDSALAGNRVLSIYEDREGDLWLGTDSGGLNVLRDQRLTTYTTRDGLSGNLVRCLLQSATGDLWIGTDGAGLDRRTRTGSAHFTTADGLSSNVILSLAGGVGGDLWIGTPDGLNLLHQNQKKMGRGEKGRVEDSAPPTACPTISSAPSTPTLTAAFGSAPGTGWPTWQGGKFTTYSSLDGLGSDFIGAILRAQPSAALADSQGRLQGNANHDLEGDLWIGTSGGLSRLHHGRFTNYTVKQGLSNDIVTAIRNSS